MLVGHESKKKYLFQLIETGRLPHSILISGISGIGKSILAKELAVKLLAKNENEADTIRRLEAGVHQDFRLIESYDGKDITVDEIRKVNHFLSIKPTESDYRVVLVDSADDFNANSANALLKTLEEPPVSGILILLAHKPGALLETIRSRCLKINLSSLKLEDFTTVIAKNNPKLIDPDGLRALYELSAGSPGMAMNLADNGGFDFMQRLDSAINNAPSNVAAFKELFELAANVADAKNGMHFSVIAYVMEAYIAKLVMHYSSTADDRLDKLLKVSSGTMEMLRDCETLNMDVRQTMLVIFSRLVKFSKNKTAA